MLRYNHICHYHYLKKCCFFVCLFNLIYSFPMRFLVRSQVCNHWYPDNFTQWQTVKAEFKSWWRHQMGTFSTLLDLCEENSPVTGEFSTQRPVTQSFDVFFDLHLNKRLSNPSRRQWFETPSRSLWRHCNVQMATNLTLSRNIYPFLGRLNHSHAA